MEFISVVVAILVIAIPIVGYYVSTLSKKSEGANIPFHVLMLGQSNLAGRGFVVSVEQPATDPSSSGTNATITKEFRPPLGLDKEYRSLIYLDDAEKSIFRLSASNTWEVAVEPLHKDIDTKKVCGLGPGLKFAQEIFYYLKQKKPSINKIGTIPCAIGGTSLDEWSKGTQLYENAVSRINSTTDKSSRKIMIWYQGETDALKQSDAETYEARLKTFIENIRTSLKNKNLLIVIVMIVGFADVFPFIDTVRNAQQRVAEADPNCILVDPNSINPGFNDDRIHLNGESQFNLGKKIAETVIISHQFNNLLKNAEE